MATEGKVGLDPLLKRRQAKLLEASDLALRERLGREVDERRASPEGQGRPQELRCALGLARGQRFSAFGDQALEAAEVELRGFDREQVAAPTRHQAPVAKRPAEVRDVDPDAVEGTRRRPITPKRVNQAVGGDDFACAQDKKCEQRPLLADADIDWLSALGHLERAEDAELRRALPSGQAPSVRGRLSAVQRRFKHRPTAPAHAQGGRGGTGRKMSVRRGLHWVVVLALMLLSLSAASSSSANERPPCRPVAEPPTPAPVVVSVRDDGFHWADAGVGAAVMLAATLLALGLAMALRPDRRSNRGREAASSARREGS